MTPKGSARAIPVDDFLAAIGEQLDRAQDALAIKARTGRPLTWALKEFKIALQVFVEFDAQGQVLWRTAGPNEAGASTVNLDFTTITKPMIEENTYSEFDETDARSIDQVGGDLSDDERVRLRRLGVRNVSQLKRLAPRDRLDTTSGAVNIPVGKLEAMLRASSRPTVQAHDIVKQGDATFLRIQGANLTDGINTEVRLAGEAVEIVDAKPNVLIVRPMEHHTSGQIEVLTAGERATGFFRMPAGYGNGSNGKTNGKATEP